MKKCLIITLMLLGVSLSSFAATCPPILKTDPYSPPPGWTALIRPIQEGQPYYFGRAIYSLNPNYHYKHVICEYRSCGTFACPGFMLISDETFETPNAPDANWINWPYIDQTLICEPKEHDPEHCIFSTEATDIYK